MGIGRRRSMRWSVVVSVCVCAQSRLLSVKLCIYGETQPRWDFLLNGNKLLFCINCLGSSAPCSSVHRPPAYGRIWTLRTQFPEHPVDRGPGRPRELQPRNILHRVGRVSARPKPDKGRKRLGKMTDRRVDLCSVYEKTFHLNKNVFNCCSFEQKKMKETTGWMKEKKFLVWEDDDIYTWPAPPGLFRNLRDFQFHIVLTLYKWYHMVYDVLMVGSSFSTQQPSWQ